jgi:hypothetical protein
MIDLEKSWQKARGDNVIKWEVRYVFGDCLSWRASILQDPKKRGIDRDSKLESIL